MLKKVIITAFFLSIIAGVALHAMGDQDQVPTEGQEYTFSAIIKSNAQWPVDMEADIWDFVREKKNVNIDMQTVPVSEYTEKLNMLIYSNQMPDWVTTYDNGSKNIIAQAANDGALLNISEHMEYFPYFQKAVEKYGETAEIAIANTKHADGNLYALPGFRDQPLSMLALFIRKDLYDKYGIAYPTTVEELYESVAAIREKEPQMIGYTSKYKENLWTTYFGTKFGIRYGAWQGLYNQSETGWEFSPATPEFRAFLEYWNKWVENDLFDIEIPIQDTKAAINKIVSGNVIAFVDYFNNESRYEADGKSIYGDQFDLMTLPHIAGPEGIKTEALVVDSHSDFFPATILKKPAHEMEALLRFVDWFNYSDEMIEVMNFGWEGKTYTRENGTLEFLPEFMENGGGDLFRKLASDYNIALDELVQVKLKEFRMLSSSNAYREYNESITDDQMVFESRLPPLNQDESDQEQMYRTTLEDYANEMVLRFLFGHIDIDREWDGFVEECESRGSLKLEELYNKAEARR